MGRKLKQQRKPARRANTQVPGILADGEKPGAAVSFPPEAGFRQASRNDRWRVVGICLLLALAVWAVFGQTLHHGFINYDDDTFVTDNPHVLGGLTWEGFKWAFRFDQGDYWHPLAWLSLMLDVSWFGRGAGGMHLTNMLLHTANSLLLFGLLRRWTGALWRSGLVAALFAIHPLRVESVAWVTERKDVLSTLFWMLTLWAYTRYAGGAKARSPRARLFYGLALLLFVLGLMSKAMLITLPLVMLLLDYWPLQRIRNFKGLLLEKIPFFLLSGLSTALTYWGQHREPAAPTAADLSLVLRLENVFVAYARYLEKTFWPVNLAVPYAHPGHWNWLEVGWSVTLVAGLCVLAWWVGRRKPYVFVGWFWFVITLIPVIGLTRGWLQFMADRFTYVPLTGIFLMVVWGAADLCGAGRWRRLLLGFAAAAMLAGLSADAYVQTGYWKNSETLWTHTLACTSGNITAYSNLGNALVKKGRFDEAMLQFQKALAISPEDAGTYVNLGRALIQKGNVNEAITNFQKALSIQPDFAEAHNNLGNAFLQKGQLDEAILQFQKGLANQPDFAEIHNNMGNALLQKGRVSEAIIQYREALTTRPDFAEAHFNLGNVLLQSGQVDEAITQFQKALAARPDYAEVHNNLGDVLLQKGQLNEAIIHFQKALAIQPGYAQAHYNLGNALFLKGQTNESIIQFKMALAVQPDYAEAHFNLGNVFLQKGQLDEASIHYQRALAIRPGFAAAQYALAHIAWEMATSPDPSARNGTKAIELAQETDHLSGGRNPGMAGTLAAAYAEAGRFAEAITTAQRALQLATSQGDTQMVTALQAQLKLYQAGRPFRN